ncbi:MAG: GC-type dockerin domain-anchored protein [Phycisphaerales bacterium JB037]
MKTAAWSVGLAACWFAGIACAQPFASPDYRSLYMDDAHTGVARRLVSTDTELVRLLVLGDSISNDATGPLTPGAQSSLAAMVHGEWPVAANLVGMGHALVQSSQVRGVTNGFGSAPQDTQRRANGTDAVSDRPTDYATYLTGERRVGGPKSIRAHTGDWSDNAATLAFNLGMGGPEWPAGANGFTRGAGHAVRIAYYATAAPGWEPIRTIRYRPQRRDWASGGVIGNLAPTTRSFDAGVWPAGEVLIDEFQHATPGADEYLFLGISGITTGAGGQDALIVTQVYEYLPDATTGFTFNMWGAGGTGIEFQLDPADPEARDDRYPGLEDRHLVTQLRAIDFPGVVFVMFFNESLLAVDDPARARRITERVVERYETAYRVARAQDAAVPEPMFVLISPYPVDGGFVSVDRADAWASIYRSVAEDGTPGHPAPAGLSDPDTPGFYASVPGGGRRIACVNLRQLLVDGGEIPGAVTAAGEFISGYRGGGYLIDVIHPNTEGARHVFGDLLWNEIAAQADGCAADLTGASDPNDASFGVPDGDADGDDFFFYLDAFGSGDLAVCDLTGSSDPNDPGFGAPDGDCDGDDFFRYLGLFESGCP